MAASVGKDYHILLEFPNHNKNHKYWQKTWNSFTDLYSQGVFGDVHTLPRNQVCVENMLGITASLTPGSPTPDYTKPWSCTHRKDHDLSVALKHLSVFNTEWPDGVLDKHLQLLYDRFNHMRIATGKRECGEEDVVRECYSAKLARTPRPYRHEETGTIDTRTRHPVGCAVDVDAANQRWSNSVNAPPSYFTYEYRSPLFSPTSPPPPHAHMPDSIDEIPWFSL